MAKDVNFERVVLLMSIASMQPNFPSLSRINAAVMEELREIEDGLAPKQKPKPEPKAIPVSTVGEAPKRSL